MESAEDEEVDVEAEEVEEAVRVDSCDDEGDDEGGGDATSALLSSSTGRVGNTAEGGDGGCWASYAARDTVSADIVIWVDGPVMLVDSMLAGGGR